MDAIGTGKPIAAAPAAAAAVAALPLRLLLAFIGLQVAAWTLAPSLVHSAPPLDVVESALWGREGLLLSSKHPNLPGLLMEAAYRLTGAYGWPDYLLSQLCIAATLAFVFALGRDLIGAGAAAAGTLLLAGCFYFSWPTPEFNHNVAQMPAWAAIAFMLWRAVERRTFGPWLLLGLVAALGMYAKFSTGVLLLAGGIWLLLDRRGRACLATARPWPGLAVFAVGLVPIALALAHRGYAPLAYADAASKGGAGILHFLGAQALDCAGMLAILLAAFPPWQARPAPPAAAVPPPSAAEHDRRAKLFLVIVGLGPLLLTALIALGQGTKDMWATPMLNLVGLAVMLPLRHRLDEAALRRLAAAAFVLVAGGAAAYAGLYLAWSQRGGPHPPRPLWPEAAIAQRLSDAWHAATGTPLRVVAGNQWLAGLVALAAPDRPSIYAGFDRAASFWITPERLSREGMLVVWEDGEKLPPPILALAADHPSGEESFAWSPAPEAVPLKLHFIVVPPR